MDAILHHLGNNDKERGLFLLSTDTIFVKNIFPTHDWLNLQVWNS